MTLPTNEEMLQKHPVLKLADDVANLILIDRERAFDAVQYMNHYELWHLQSELLIRILNGIRLGEHEDTEAYQLFCKECGFPSRPSDTPPPKP